MHIEAKNFDTKKEMYSHICSILPEMLEDNPAPVSALANSTALLHFFLHDINWVGFYIARDGALILGPFQGKPAVASIGPGEGVCGTAANEGQTQIVNDVHKCENHIACDISSASEIVVPMIKNGKTLGVLDIDSPTTSRFDADDGVGLEEFVKILITHIHWRDDNVF